MRKCNACWDVKRSRRAELACKKKFKFAEPGRWKSPRYEMYYVMKVDLALLMEFKKGPPSGSRKWVKAAQRLGNKASLNADRFVWSIR